LRGAKARTYHPVGRGRMTEAGCGGRRSESESGEMSSLVHRPRRLRRTEAVRALVREARLARENLILPLFACPGEGVRREVSSMPGVFNLSIDEIAREAANAYEAGVPGVILFGLPESKDETATGAYAERGIVQEAVRAVRRAVPDMVVIADTCLCEYTSHGHCGVVRDGEVLNDESLELIARTAVSQAAAGADIVAPSAMMDGQVGAIREALDDGGFEQVAIMSYAVKYASAFYGPFREAADSTPAFGDRRAYQMDAANAREAIREAELDVLEGADFLMVKPAGPYLDILRLVRERFDLPLAAYHVSGEYAMLKAAAQRGWIDEKRAMLETLTGIRRAGADVILTYYAVEAARELSRR
jgi:porphobilinogen synthase